jgi:hypothetical protein
MQLLSMQPRLHRHLCGWYRWEHGVNLPKSTWWCSQTQCEHFRATVTRFSCIMCECETHTLTQDVLVHVPACLWSWPCLRAGSCSSEPTMLMCEGCLFSC